MLVFPQLSSGANVQYPLARTEASRTVVNVLQDGSMVKFEDVSGGRTRWELRLDSLDEAERQAVEAVFLATEGELQTFTLLDPTVNLLSWSEDLSKPAWVAEPLLQVVAGSSDPTGGTGAWQLTNAGQASQQVSQTIAGPGQFEYCFSVYVRGTGNAGLARSTTGAPPDVRTFPLSATWQRISSAGRLGGASNTFQAAIVLEAGATVQVFGPQLEAQPAPGPYRRSQGASGAIQVRFEGGQLRTIAGGLDRNSSVIRLVSVE